MTSAKDQIVSLIHQLEDDVERTLDVPQLEVTAGQSSRGYWRVIVKRKGDARNALVSYINNRHATPEGAIEEAVRLFGNVHGVTAESIHVVPHEEEEDDEE